MENANFREILSPIVRTRPLLVISHCGADEVRAKLCDAHPRNHRCIPDGPQ